MTLSTMHVVEVNEKGGALAKRSRPIRRLAVIDQATIEWSTNPGRPRPGAGDGRPCWKAPPASRLSPSAENGSTSVCGLIETNRRALGPTLVK